MLKIRRWLKIKAFTLRLENELHKKIKIKTAKEEITMQDYIISLIEKDMKESNLKTKPNSNI